MLPVNRDVLSQTCWEPFLYDDAVLSLLELQLQR